MAFETFPKNKIRAIFSDLDDTLTLESRFLATTLTHLEKLQELGFWLVVVSGRPAGWADCFMRLLPIDAMVFENGAGVMIRKNGKIVTHQVKDKNTHLPEKKIDEKIEREIEKKILETHFESLKRLVPTLKTATDQPFRLFDYTIDFIEEPPFLSEQEIKTCLDYLQAQKGITAKMSSIHINYWIGTHTKVTAVEYLLQEEGKLRNISKNNVLYFGDSPNDEPLFEFFPYSVGVSNIQKFLSTLKTKPTWITQLPGSRGFSEFIRFLLA